MSAAAMLEAEAARQAQQGLKGPHAAITHCVDCGKPFVFGQREEGANVYTMAGARDTQIVATCESCFDSYFDGEDE